VLGVYTLQVGSGAKDQHMFMLDQGASWHPSTDWRQGERLLHQVQVLGTRR
jgi:hypothetical protein